MRKQWLLSLNLFFSGIVVLLLIVSSGQAEKQFFSAPADNVPQVIKSADLDKKFSFCGETLPMDEFDVRERLDRELLVNTYWQSSTMMALKSSKRFFPIMDRILTEEGVPTDLKYLAVAESSLRNVTSHAGAKGVWQFMNSAASDYNLEVTDEVDERYHLEKSTRAAARYLKSLRNRFGSWAYAAAAYNTGAGNLNKHIDSQRAEDYYDLNLNDETSRYFFRLAAIKAIMESPRDFGYYVDEKDYYPALDDYKEIEVTGAVANWGDFAKEHGTTYRILKIYNPWLTATQLSNRSGKRYTIHIPR